MVQKSGKYLYNETG
jgi:fucose permease